MASVLTDVKSIAYFSHLIQEKTRLIENRQD